MQNYCRKCPREGDCQRIVPCRLDEMVKLTKLMFEWTKAVNIRNSLKRSFNMTNEQIDEIIEKAKDPNYVKG